MKLTKTQKSWIFYDVANSAFTLILTATIPVFFRGLVDAAGVSEVCNNIVIQTLFTNNAQMALAGDLQAFEAIKTSLFALTTTLAVVIVAVSAPVMGAIADYKGMKKKLFMGFLLLGVTCCLLLGVTSSWVAYLALIIVARIGYASCNIFYDSMLVDVAEDDEMDKVSSYGYAWGYIGSCLPFLVGIYLILFMPFGLDITTATQISFIIVAAWWLIGAIPLLKNVQQRYGLEHQENLVKSSFSRIGQTLKKIKANKRMLYFIIAYFCYIDGVYTIISMSTTYGAEVGIQTNDMIIALLVTQIVAFPFAIISGKMASKYNVLDILRVYIVMYVGICLYGFQLSTAFDFWVLCVLVGMAQGGIQSLSRSYFGKIVPKNESNEYYGFFDIFGKFADFLGPLIITVCATVFGTSRYGILALVILFIIGFILISKVRKLEN
ncbi:MAG: MFS transporter [Erysipelotrichaceae bacterium]